MNIETTLLLRQIQQIERGLTLLENNIHDIRWDLYKLKNPSHLYDEAIMDMEMGERNHEACGF